MFILISSQYPSIKNIKWVNILKMDEEKEEKIKIILLGEISTGKTSLINVYFNYGF